MFELKEDKQVNYPQNYFHTSQNRLQDSPSIILFSLFASTHFTFTPILKILLFPFNSFFFFFNLNTKILFYTKYFNVPLIKNYIIFSLQEIMALISNDEIKRKGSRVSSFRHNSFNHMPLNQLKDF